jgi:protein O-GlcNAc transferase
VTIGLHLLLAGTNALADQAATAEAAGDYNRAIQLLDQALKLTPRDASLHIAQGTALYHESYLADAIREFRLALSLHPGDVDALSNLASAWMQIGDLQDALPALEQAAAQQPADPELLDRLGLAYLQAGNWRQAAQLYQRLSQSDAANAVLLYDLAIAQKHLDDTSAQGLLRRALALQPDFPAAQMELAELLWQQGCLPEAQSLLQGLLQLHPDFLPAYFPLAEILRQIGRSDDAFRAARAILQSDPDNASAYQELAILEKGLGHSDAAALDFHRAELQRNRVKLQQASQIALQSGIRLLRQGQPKQAIAKFRFALELDQDNAQAHYWLALAAEHQPAQAALEFQKAYAGDHRLKPPFSTAR